MKKTLEALFVVAAVAVSGAAIAQDTTLTDQQSARSSTMESTSTAQGSSLADPQMMLTLHKMYPSTQFKEVNRTALPGIFEVVMGQNVAYADQSGRYFMFGHLFDMQSQQDLTVSRIDNANKIDIGQLPLSDAIKIVKGNGSRTMYVFSDPDCPFCKQLEQNLTGMTDVTMYVFLFPIEGLHPQAKAKAVGIWCAKDRAGAWNAWMHNGVLPAAVLCDNPVDRNIALGERFGVTGTPTLIAADGRRMAGAAPADRISNWLSSVKVPSSASISKTTP
jgi:thiol:disulfide interchange protein DsbC